MPSYVPRGKSKKGRKSRNTLSKKVSNLANFVYKTIEKKQITMVSDIHDDANNNISDANWNYVELTRMGQNPTGSRNNNRVGNDITMQSINFTMMIEDWQPGYIGRLLIVQYSNKTTAPGGADLEQILEYGTTDASTTPPVLEPHVIQSPYRVGSTLKYKVLRDIKIKLPIGIKAQLLSYKITLTPKGKRGFDPILSFEASLPNSESAYKGNIYAYWRYTDHNINVGPAVTKELTFTHRMTYRDA